MFSQYIDARYAIYLLIATVWATVFSLTIRQPLRGCRNLGILAPYILFIVMLFRLPFLTALRTWCLFGIAGGLMYIFYELLVRWRTKDAGEKPRVSPVALLHGPLVWPVMIPEAIENSLAELGLLADKVLNLPPFPPLHWDGSQWEGEVVLPSWAGFQSRRGAYGSVSSEAASDGNISLTVEGAGPPLPAQVSAFQFLLDHEPAVAAAALGHVFSEYPRLREAYDPGEEESDELMPPIDRAEQLKGLIGLSSIYVLRAAKDGVAYVGFEFGCTWDEEHGLGVMTHRDRVVELGQADASFRPPAEPDSIALPPPPAGRS